MSRGEKTGVEAVSIAAGQGVVEIIGLSVGSRKEECARTPLKRQGKGRGGTMWPLGSTEWDRESQEEGADSRDA